MKILFITANRVGDAVLSTGVLSWLVEKYPGAQITVACGPYAAGLFYAVPGLEQILVIRKRPWNLHWVDFWSICIETYWDLIVDLRNTAASRFLRAEKRVTRGGSKGRHKVVENAAVLKLNPPPAPHVWLDERAMQEAKALLPEAGTLLAMAPAANWPPKEWPAERFAALAHKLTAADGLFPDAIILLIGGKPERSKIDSLLEAFPAGRAIPVVGLGLLTVAACLGECSLFVGNDSGLMHMAAAMHTPTLGLFGPGQEDIYGPWGEWCASVRTPESREDLLRRLPVPGASTPNLMETLSVERVYEAAVALIGSLKR